MYNSNYSMPTCKNNMCRNKFSNNDQGYYDERGFWIPFAIGGLAGGALGYGIANNNFISNNPGYYYRPPYGPVPVPVPYYPYPYM